MSMEKNRTNRRKGSLPFLLIFSLFLPTLFAQSRMYNFTTSSGLKVRIIQDVEMSFLHSQLIVFYDRTPKMPSPPIVPYLMLYDMFEEQWQRSTSKISGDLQRMGDDFEFQHTPEYLRVTVNFLPERMGTFASYLREFFTYGSFSLKRFNRIKAGFKTIFRKNRDWKEMLAFQVAYRHLFGDTLLGNVLITPEQVRTVTLAQILSFYRSNIRPDRALLIIRGKVNPYQMFGAIEREMIFSVKKIPPQKITEKPAINSSRKIFLIPTVDADPPVVFFFDVAPPFDNARFISFYIVEYSLFHFPFGRIYRSSRVNPPLQELHYPLNNEMVNHRDLSVMCSHTAVAPGEIESLVALVEQEKKRLVNQPVRREEFVNAINFLQSKTRIDSIRFTSEVEVEIGKAIAENRPVYLEPSTDMFQRVSFEGIDEVVEEYFTNAQRSGSRERGVVVIVGNEEQILANWKGNRPEIIKVLD